MLRVQNERGPASATNASRASRHQPVRSRSMTDKHPKRVHVVPLLAGCLLFTGAVALLCEDAWHGHVALNHLLQPLLMAGTIVAGVMSHHRLARLRVSGLAFALLAVMGSAAVIYATLSR